MATAPAVIIKFSPLPDADRKNWPQDIDSEEMNEMEKKTVKLSNSELEQLKRRAIEAAQKNSREGDAELMDIIKTLLSQFSEETQRQKLLRFFGLNSD